MRRKTRALPGATLVAGLLALVTPALAQSPRPAARPLGPGDPLPPLSLNYENGSLEVAGTRAMVTDGVLTFGDVRIEAERIEFDNETLRITATGNVVLTRGDETVRGSSFLFDPENAVGVALDAVAVSPPFYVSGGRVESTPTGLIARNALVTACPEGKGELRITAQQVELVNDRYLILRRPSFYLFGMRLLTLPRYRLLVTRGRGREREEYALSIPIRIRSSQISGLVIGVSLPFDLGAGYEGDVAVDLPSRRPTQYAVTVRRDFLGDQPEERPRGLFADPTRRDEAGQDESPLRSFLRARPLPPPPDPVLDFEDVVPGENPVAFPTRTPPRDLRGAVNVWVNREIGDRRRTELLLSRVPEVRLVGRLPLAASVPPSNEAARAYLRRPRPLLTADVSVGRYEEQELGGDQRSTTRSRIAATAGIGTLPLLLADRILVRPQLLLTYQGYDGGASYRVAEANLAGSYVFGPRTALGAAYIRRFASGRTPFLFDVVDTTNEAQVRGQVSFGGGKYTVGTLLRYDVDQSQFFDFQIALALRLRSIEPRLTYGRLGQQIGLTIALPGLTL